MASMTTLTTVLNLPRVHALVIHPSTAMIQGEQVNIFGGNFITAAPEGKFAALMRVLVLWAAK